MEDKHLLFPGEPQPPEPPLSPENARVVIARAWQGGAIQFAGHFKARGKERGFTTVDVGAVLRSGGLIGDPEYCPDFDNWKYRLRGAVEDSLLEVVVALDRHADFCRSPLIVLITAYWK